MRGAAPTPSRLLPAILTIFKLNIMKQSALAILLLIAASAVLLGQAPQKLSWQGIVRDANGDPYKTTPVTLRFTVFDGAVAIYTEDKQITTNGFGLAVHELGSVDPASFATINWSSGNKKLGVALKVGFDFISLGTEELKSVPYALYANRAASADNIANDKDNQTLAVSGNTISISGGNSQNLPADKDNQTLAVSGNTISISGGNSQNRPADKTTRRSPSPATPSPSLAATRRTCPSLPATGRPTTAPTYTTPIPATWASAPSSRPRRSRPSTTARTTTGHLGSKTTGATSVRWASA